MLSKNVVVFFISTLAFYFVGFALMFSDGSKYLGTSLPQALFARGSYEIFSVFKNTNLPIEAIFFFQIVFAGTAATIVSGAVAERIKFIAFLLFTFFLACLIYPISGHWISGRGLLYELGVRDFAGALMVHTVGGMAALSGVILLGPRVGKYNKDQSPNAILGHSIPMVTLGGFILWLGWFGFNLGCTLGFSPKLCSHIILCTNACAICGGVGALITSWILLRKPDLSMVISGLLGGLVSSTSACAFVSLPGAHIIGFIAGCLVVISILSIDRIFHIDDPVGAISVHGIGGIWGALSLGLFSLPGEALANIPIPKAGLFYGGGVEQLLCQLIGIGCIIVWSFTISFIIWLILKHTIGIRVSQREEVDGLDIGQHGMEAYPGFASSGENII